MRVREIFEKLYPDNPTLECLCYEASPQLFQLAKDRGFKIKLAGNKLHVFCLFKNMIIDITATQFDSKERVLIRRPAISSPKYWVVEWETDKVEKLYDYDWGGYIWTFDETRKNVLKEMEKENDNHSCLDF